MLARKSIVENAKLHNFSLKEVENDFLDILEGSALESRDDFARDVAFGLGAEKKFLSPKYFYDSIGSELFVKITQTPEYYPTRTEKSILRTYASEIVDKCADINYFVELGSGSAEKTVTLLEEFFERDNTPTYIPIDVSDIIIESSEKLIDRYDDLSVTGIISDYENGLSFVSKLENGSKLVLFLGSSIGNFNPFEIENFLKMIRKSLNKDDYILIGFDLVKDREVLEAAYNDVRGVTRDFNLNILRRINKELGGNFDTRKFRHHAFFNQDHSRIEMHLVSREAQTVLIKSLDLEINFKAEETIHTENSHKFTKEMIHNYAQHTQLVPIETWTDPKEYFALCLFKPDQLK